MPPNDSLRNYILYNTFFLITTDDNCVASFFILFYLTHLAVDGRQPDYSVVC